MKTKKTDIPESSLLRQYLPVDHTDAFRITADRDIDASPDDMMAGLWLDMPGWVNAMVRLRNFLVKFVGLKGSGGGSAEELEKCIRTGGTYRFVEVPAKSGRETVMIMRDRHLDAYFSVLKSDDRNIYVNTLVRYNKRMGKVYFFFIRPFHGMIMRAALKRIAGRS